MGTLKVGVKHRHINLDVYSRPMNSVNKPTQAGFITCNSWFIHSYIELHKRVASSIAYKTNIRIELIQCMA
jgi:hypothetical protein